MLLDRSNHLKNITGRIREIFMGLLSSIVLVALAFVIALAIAAASSAPHSVQLSEDFSPSIQVPINSVRNTSQSREGKLVVTGRLTSVQPLAKPPAPSQANPHLIAPPLVFAAGLQ
jgi:hypothetical protein